MRKYRGTGVALEAARNVFARFPGDWQVRELAANAVAIAFWRRAIPVPFDEGVNTEGPIQTFRIAEIDYPVVMAARERLRAIFGAPWGRPPETMTLVGTARTTGDSAGLTIRPCGGTSAPRTAPRSR